MRYLRILGLLGLVVITFAIMLVGSPARPTGAYAASTATPPATIDPRAFDMTNATDFVSQDGLLEIFVPKQWNTAETTNQGVKLYAFVYNPGRRLPVGINLIIAIGSAKTVYQSVLSLSQPADTPTDALQAYLDKFPGTSASPIESASAGGYVGAKVAVDSPAAQGTPAINGEVWIVTLPGDQVSLIILLAQTTYWNAGGKNVLYKMVDTLKFNLEGTDSSGSSEGTPTAVATSGAPARTRTPVGNPTAASQIIPIPLVPNQ